MAVTVKKANNNAKVVINQLVIKAPNRKVSDVGTWRNAIKSADIGRPRDLFDLFDDLYLDGVLFDAVDKRTKAVTNADLVFQNADNEPVQEITDLIDTTGFEDLLTILMKSRFWGRCCLELDFKDGFKVSEIPAKHIDLNNQVILLDLSAGTGIAYEGNDQLMVVGQKNDFGLFIRTAPYIIWKRGGFGDYAQWLELFGMPQRIGKYSSYDPESRRLLEEALEKAGSAPYAVIPKETEVEVVDKNGQNSSGDSYNQFRQACNEETLITILGQTLTTVQGERGARALGEVHKAVEESKNKADMRFIQHILNTTLLPILEKRGFPVAGGKFVFPKEAEPLTVAEIVSLSTILPIPTAHLYKRYSIPAPKDGEEIAGKQETPATIAAAPKDGEEIAGKQETPATIAAEPNENADGKPPKSNIKNTDKPDKPLKPLDTLKSLIQNLHDFFAKAPAAMTGATKNCTKKLTGSIKKTINLADKNEPEFQIDITALFNKALKEIYNTPTPPEGDGRLINRTLFEITNKALQTGINSQFTKAGLEFGTKNQAFIDEFKHNTAVFAAFKNHQQTKEITELLIDEKEQLRSFYAFKKLADKVSRDYNVNWLRTEYNTAVRAARQAVNWRQYEATKHLYPNLEYIRSTANNRRPIHEAWAGTILPITHPWWDTHMPPSDWNCQCSIRQTDSPETPVPDEIDKHDPVFKNNPGKTAEFIKIKEHPYIKRADKWVQKEVDDFLKKQLLAEARSSVKEFFKADYHNDKISAENLRTGVFYDSKKGLKELVHHSISADEIEAAMSVPENISKLKFVRISLLGEGKDMTNPVDIENVAKKEERGVKQYNIYSYEYKGKTYYIKTEEYVHGDESLYTFTKEP